MVKNKTLKYIILMFVAVMSFFMLSHNQVKASEGWSFTFEQVDLVDVSKGYSITGVSCAGECSDSLEIPDTYNGYAVVSISDGSDGVGVLNSAKDLVVTVSGGNNLQTVGLYAFSGFSRLEEVSLASSVTLIRENAFLNSALKTIFINRYRSLENPSFSELENVNVFSGINNEVRIVVANNTVLSTYRNADVWKELTNVFFTYKVTYHFYSDEVVNYAEDRVYYVGEQLSSIPSELTSAGFVFDGWISDKGGYKVTENSIAEEGSQNNLTHSIEAKWSLALPELSILAQGDGVSNNEKIYNGRENELEMVVSYVHDLSGTEGFEVTYTWKRNHNSIWSVVGGNSNLYSISLVSQSGTYACEVTVQYGEYESSSSIEIEVNIEPKELLIKVNGNETVYGEYVGAKEVNGRYFEVDSEKSLVNGEEIKNYEVAVYSNDNKELVVGTYTDVLKIEILNIGYADSESNYVSNYSIEYDYGDLSVVQKEVEINLLEDFVFSYGDNENLTGVYIDSVYDNNVINEISLVYDREDISNRNAGNYRIVGVTGDNSNYSFSLSASSEGKVVINPKLVAVKWDIPEYLVYDGTVKSVSASYENIEENDVLLDVVITKNDVVSEFKNAGTYELVASGVSDGNYELTGEEMEITIEKADSVFIGDIYQTKVYNGVAQRVDVTLNHNESILVYGDYSSFINANLTTTGVYKMLVSVDESENYKALSMTYSLHIDPYELVVEPDLFEVTYGQTLGQNVLSKVYKGVKGEDVLVCFSKEGGLTSLDVGYYNIVGAYLTNNTNYVATMVPGTGSYKIKIVPAPVDVRFFFYENLKYDGNVKNIGIRVDGTSEDVGLVVDYNGKDVIKNAGSYRIDLSVSNSNFYLRSGSYLEFSIAKGDYDISGLKLENKKINYNFKNHFINLEGDLPEGLTVSYSIDNRVGNGTSLPFKHIVRVTFEGDFDNYNYIEPMEAVLNIDMTWVFVVFGSILFIIVGMVVAFVVLTKFDKIGVIKRRKVIRDVIRKKRVLDSVNAFISERSESLKEEKDIIIEESVKFVKNPVKIDEKDIVALSFVDKLFRSTEETKQYYSDIKNELLSYEGIVSKIKRDYETFYLNNMPVAKMNVVDGLLQVYFALDPSIYRKEEYHHVDVSGEKDFVATPLKLVIATIDDLRNAKMFVRIIRKSEGLKFVSNFVRTDYVKVYTSRDNAFKVFKKVFVKKGKNREEMD